MKIKILGTRGKIKESRPGHIKHSGILIDNKILFDLGEKEYLKYRPAIIILTHFHPDHLFFAGTREKIKINVPVYAPEPLKSYRNIKILTAPLKKFGYTIIPVPTIHSLKLKSQGYLIEKKGKRIFYSADMLCISRYNRRKLGWLDLVITEGSFIRKGGLVKQDENGRKFGHAGVPDLINFFKKHTNRIIITHFGTWFMKDTSAAENKIKSMVTENLSLEIAVDGKEYRI